MVRYYFEMMGLDCFNKAAYFCLELKTSPTKADDVTTLVLMLALGFFNLFGNGLLNRLWVFSHIKPVGKTAGEIGNRKVKVINFDLVM